MKKTSVKKQKLPRRGLLERRDKILKIAAEVFSEKGLEKTTLDEIAERAGVGKGTIYRRIGNKDELITFLLKEAAMLLVGAIKQEVKKTADPLFQFKEIISALCDFYENNITLVMLLIPQCVTCINLVQVKELGGAKDVFQTIEDILQKAIQKREIRPVNTHIIAKGLISFLNPYLYQYLRTKANYTKSEIAQLTIDLFLDGLRKRKYNI